MSATLAPDSQLEDLGYQPSLNRQLPFGSLVVYGLLFFVPMAPVAVFGPVVNRSGGVPVLVYLVAAAVMGLSAISYREMSLRFPVAGSVYGYTRFSLGRTPGFIAGWLILLDYILMPALLTVLSAVALAHIWPSVPRGIFAVVFVLASMALSLQGMTVTIRVGIVLLAIQLGTIAIFLVCVGSSVASGDVVWSWHALWRPGTSWASVASAVSIAALSYLGFDAVATLNEEARGGGRAVGIATLCLVGLLAVVFGVQVLAAGLVSDTTHFAAGGATNRAFYHAVDQVCPSWFTLVFIVVNAFVAIFACLVVAHSSTARLVFAMARDKVMPSLLSRTNSKGVPWVAIVAVAAVTSILAVAFDSHVETMTTLVTFGALSSYVFLHADVIVQCVFKERSHTWVRHLMVPILGAITLLIAVAKTEEMTRIVGLSWLAAGVIGAIIARTHRSRQAGKLTSHQA
ncbi:APC family permease [Cutibacterium sp. V947]|uniref:APC family permease n=1 Tax=Cutibacterium sp. V947 TaxID=3446480 RepID=UPI003EE3F7C4